MEQSEFLVVLGHRTLTLKHMDLYGRLVVCSRGEDLALMGRDGGIRVDELCHHAAQGLDTE